MTPFEHLSVLISIVIGLGIAHLLTAVQHLIQARERIVFYWLPLAWAVLVLVTQVEWWWSSFSLEGQSDWNFFYFLFLLLSPVALFLASALVLPAIEAGQDYDLRGYYESTHRWFFGVLTFNPLLDAIRRGLEFGTVQEVGVWSNTLATLLLLSLAVVRSARYHVVATLIVAALFLYFIVSAVLRL
jgi:hypothetical protein